MNSIKVIRNFLGLCVIFMALNMKAGIETVNSRIAGTSQIKANASVSVQDNQYPNVTLANTAKVVKATSKVIFSINTASSSYLNWSYSKIKLGLQLTSYNAYGGSQTLPSVVELEVGNALSGSTYSDKSIYVIDGSHKVTATIVYIKDQNNAIIADASVPQNLALEVEQTTERYYNFSTSTIATTLGNNYISASNELDIFWNKMAGAEEYELEWNYVNDYSATGADLLPTEVYCDFRNNSTRVRISQNHYLLSLLFDKGYIVYRVRAVGRSLVDPSKELFSSWSAPDAGYIQDYTNLPKPPYPPLAPYYRITIATRHESNKNWQYSSSFAEEGKKSESVVYFDGSLRDRQSVAKSSTLKKTIVGEKIYDYQGRAAVQVLPVPTAQPILKYNPDFNKNMSGAAYSRKDFDEDTNGSSCTSPTNPMDSLVAASSANYYSQSNPNLAGFQSYAPNAKQFPFSQVEYTPDNTGRIRRQGGVGKDFQLGSGHETKYFYGQPEQIQLDRLFGSEAGDCMHYKKNMVMDANGQVSVSYLDQAGRTVATSLAGNAPANLTALPGTDPTVQLTVDYIKSSDPLVPNQNKFQNNALLFSKELTVATAGNYSFYYDVTAPRYQDACLSSPICFDCMYDLEISVLDACGTPMFPSVKQSVGQLDSICSGGNLNFTLPPNPVVAYLPVGEYTVSKRLTISEKAIDYYTDKFVKYNTCITTYNTFLNTALTRIDTADCEITCAGCVASLGAYSTHNDVAKGDPANPSYDPNYKYLTLAQYQKAVKDCKAPCEPVNLCEAEYQTLLADVSPNGQYAKYIIDSTGNFSVKDTLSVLKIPNLLPNTTADWRHPKRTLPGGTVVTEYRDEDDTRTKIFVNKIKSNPTVYTPDVDTTLVSTLPDGRTYVYPEQLKNTVDFINTFNNHPEWAKSLVEYHPEYAYYKWCIQNNDTLYSYTGTPKLTSDAFDAKLRLANTYLDAVNALYTDNTTNAQDIFSKDPYFNNTTATPNTGQGSNQRTTMTAILGNYAASGMTLKAFSATTTRCGTTYYGTLPGTCDDYGTGTDASIKDKEWVLYRNMYLAEKQKLQQMGADLYAIGQSRFNGCIGVKDKPFNPWSGGPFDFSSIQPCGYNTWFYYRDKIKRFQNANDALIQQGIDPNADNKTGLNTLANNVEYKMYQETGQCPVANDLGFLLENMASKNLLLSAGVKLTDISTFTKRLYDAVIAPLNPNSTTFINYYWSASVSGSDLTIQFRENSAAGTPDACTVILTLPPGNLWSDVKHFSTIKASYTSSGTSYFSITGYIDTTPNDTEPPTRITVNGSTCINLDGCSFNDNCGPSEMAFQLGNLFSGLASKSKLTTNNVDIKTTPYDALFVKNLIAPTTNPYTGAVWNGTASGGTLELKTGSPAVTTTSSTFSISFVNTGGGFSLSSILYFTNLRVNPANPTKSLTADAWLSSNQFQPVTITQTSTFFFNVQKCLPPPNRCTGPEYKTNETLFGALNTVASQGKLLTTFPLKSTLPELTSLFPFTNANNTFWTINDYNAPEKYLVVDLAEYIGGDTVPKGSLVLSFQDTQNPHTYLDIRGFSNFLFSEFYNEFTVLARFSDGTGQLLSGRLEELKLVECGPCTDENYISYGDCECEDLGPTTSGLSPYTSSGSCSEGYALTPDVLCSNWLAPGPSHSGKFMYIHYNGADTYLWKQNITWVIPNKDYFFRVFFKRKAGTFDLTMKINGVVTKVVNVTPAKYPADLWYEMSCIWNSGANDYADVEVDFHKVDLATDTYFGLDDFTLQLTNTCGNPFQNPLIIPYVNPCVKNLKNIAKTNADEMYKAYINTVKATFRDNYVSTCKNALENLKMVYNDREHHITLYYYDQAGNLIKTVPPEGVNLVTAPADLTQIKQDRLNKTQTFFTSHTLQTHYEYNALNQLIRQATPDNDLLNKWKLNGVNLIPATTKIYGMAFSNGSNGIVVGDDGSGNGVIYKTTDGGKTWNRVTALDLGNLQDVQYIGTTGYAITDRGELVKNTGNWSPVATPTTQKLNDLYFSSATAGVIVGNGGVILKTSNSGSSWDPVTIDPAALNGIPLSSVNFNDAHFTSATTGYVAGSKGIVLRTTNGGTNWSALPGITNPLNTTLTLNAIHFLSATSGYVAGVDPATGKGVIALATINAGQTSTTWTYPKQTPAATACEFKTIYAVDANNVFAAGTNGNLYAVSDSSAGAFVKYAISGLTGAPEINELSFPNASPNQYVGYGSARNGQIIKSAYASGLITWTASNVIAGSIVKPPLTGLFFDPTITGTGYLSGDEKVVLKTIDAGANWTSSSITNYNLPAIPMEDVYMIKDGTVGYAVGKGGRLEKTTNSGTSWTNISTGIPQDLKGIACEDVNTGIIVGTAGRILKLVSGSSVSAITGSPAITTDLYDVVQLASPASTYIAVGASGKIIKGTSGTSTWTNNITSGTTQPLYAVYFVGNIGYAAGGNGTILKSINSGATWTTLSSGVTATLRELFFKDNLTGYALGDGGTIIKTVDGGLNWKQQAGTAIGDFYAGNFAADGTAIIGGVSTGSTISNMASLNDETNSYSSRFWYDRLGRMIVSQNGKQYKKIPTAYSYTKYDALGRITEVGEVATATDLAGITDISHGVINNDQVFKSWLTAGIRSEVTTTVYDEPVSPAVPGLTQENLRKRVSAVYIDPDGDLQNGYTHASIYSYDIHGNVKTLIQDINALKEFSQGYKRVDYKYDLISGKVNQVCYQQGQSDQFYHKYEYDADNRITRVFTSNNGYIWDQDAKYFYYDHGPLARVELGNDKVQALDQVYTLQGWLKGVNSNTLNTTRDPGKDGTVGTQYTGYAANIHSKIGKDIYGYSLSYFDKATGVNNDYYAINPSMNAVGNDFEADASLSPGYMSDAPNLYNGNIKRMVSTITDIQTGSPTIGQAQPQLTAYKYDQLNRIVQLKAYRDINVSTNISGAATSSAYQSTMSYDANGNILTMNVNGNTTTPNMDQLAYKYDWIDPAIPSKGKRSNRLYHVNDNTGYTNNYVTDIDDQGSFTPAATNNLTLINTANNYGYDELGNLKRDKQEEISNIEWTVYGKIRKIERDPLSYKNPMDFTYDAQGNRLSRTVYYQSGYKTTFYVRDGGGNIMALYEKLFVGSVTFNPVEYSLYGSSRIGTQTAYATSTSANTYTRLRRNKNYELSNHLGNVLTVISDYKVPHTTNGTSIDYYNAEGINTSDYYAFGAPMPGRGYSSSLNYRYGFNGKEKDDEVVGNGNQYDYGMRIYNPRLGRFLSTDPLFRKYPELTTYQFASNTPIQAIDLDGLEKLKVINNRDFGLKMVLFVLNSTQVWKQFQKDIKDPAINPEKRDVYIGTFNSIQANGDPDPLNFDKNGNTSSGHYGSTTTIDEANAFSDYGINDDFSGGKKAEVILLNKDYSSFISKNLFKNTKAAIQAMKAAAETVYHEGESHVLDDMQGDKHTTKEDHQKFYGNGVELQGNNSPNYTEVDAIGDSPASTAKRQIESSGNKVMQTIEKIKEKK